MKGSILDFNLQENSGVISGDDGKRYAFQGPEWKAKVNPEPGLKVDFTCTGESATAIYADTTPSGTSTTITGAPDLTGLSPYYQEEFKKIWSSKDSYKGKWNWAAFWFGGIWALTKGAWLSILVCLVVGILTFGIGFVVYWFIYASRGTYIYYNAYVKHRQIAW